MHIKQIFSAYSGTENLHFWEFKYCPMQNTIAYKKKGGRQRPSCSNCGFVQYRNPAPGVIVGELGVWDDLANLEWIPLSALLSKIAFEADSFIIERHQKIKTKLGCQLTRTLHTRSIYKGNQ